MKNRKKIENTCSECILWIKLDKDVTGFELILGAVYLPCEGSIYHHHDIFSDIARDLITLKSEFDVPVCLIGDFNARTGLLDDFYTLKMKSQILQVLIEIITTLICVVLYQN